MALLLINNQQTWLALDWVLSGMKKTSKASAFFLHDPCEEMAGALAALFTTLPIPPLPWNLLALCHCSVTQCVLCWGSQGCIGAQAPDTTHLGHTPPRPLGSCMIE